MLMPTELVTESVLVYAAPETILGFVRTCFLRYSRSVNGMMTTICHVALAARRSDRGYKRTLPVQGMGVIETDRSRQRDSNIVRQPESDEPPLTLSSACVSVGVKARGYYALALLVQV